MIHIILMTNIILMTKIILNDEEDSSETMTRKHRHIAKSEALFRHYIQPTCLCFLITATHLAAYVKGMLRQSKKQNIQGIPFYIMDQKAVFIRIRKSESYAGIEDMQPIFSAETEQLDGIGLLNHPMLEHYAKEKNNFDGRQLELKSGVIETNPLIIKGSLFISISRNVNVNKHNAHEICRQLCTSESTLVKLGKKPLVICYVGNPMAYTVDNNPLSLERGNTLEESVNYCLGKGIDYDRLVFVGWNMTKRSMTATFISRGKLITPLYSIIKFPNTLKLDADAQRLLRMGHDFGLYKKPEGYQMDVSTYGKNLEVLKKYLALESEAFEEQEKNPKTYREFLTGLGEKIVNRGLLGHKVGKPGLSTNSIAKKSSEDISDKKWAEIAEGKRPVGCTWDGKIHWIITQRDGNVLRNKERTRVALENWKTAKKICEDRDEYEKYVRSRTSIITSPNKRQRIL